MTFKEDACRARKNYSARNLNLLRKFTLAILRQQNDKLSLKARRWKCSLQPDYLKKVLRFWCGCPDPMISRFTWNEPNALKNNMLMPYDILWHNKRKSLSLRNKPWFSRIYNLSTRISTRKPQNSCDFGAFSFTFYHPPINAFVRRLMWSACLFMMSSFSSTSSCNCSTLRNSSACWSHWYAPQMLV